MLGFVCLLSPIFFYNTCIHLFSSQPDEKSQHLNISVTLPTSTTKASLMGSTRDVRQGRCHTSPQNQKQQKQGKTLWNQEPK